MRRLTWSKSCLYGNVFIAVWFTCDMRGILKFRAWKLDRVNRVQFRKVSYDCISRNLSEDNFFFFLKIKLKAENFWNSKNSQH